MKKRIRHLGQQWLRAGRRLEQKMMAQQRDQKQVQGTEGEPEPLGTRGVGTAARKTQLWKLVGLQGRPGVCGHEPTGIWVVAGVGWILEMGAAGWRCCPAATGV